MPAEQADGSVVPATSASAWVAALATAFAIGCAGTAAAQALRCEADLTPVNVANVRLDALEDAFWVCDYAATRGGTSSTDVTACVAIYDALKERKFAGDFDKLLQWWQAGKPAAHERLQIATRSKRS